MSRPQIALSTLSRALGVAASVAASVAVVTFLGFRVVPVNGATIGFAYLLLILVTATFWGVPQSILASILAVVCLNFFFLPPVGQFTIADPQNWVALFAFLITAVLVSKLSDASRLQTWNALEREKEVERLYALSRGILLTEPGGSVPAEVALQVARVFNLPAVSLYVASTGVIHRSGMLDLLEWDDRLREVARSGVPRDDAESSTYLTAVRLGGDPIGSLALRDAHFSDSALQAATNLVAIALERERALERASHAELARRGEDLRSTLLDAIAHEFKTPLTSIKLAASTLRTSSAPPLERELAAIIDEEASRLQVLVSNTVRMARIDAGRVQLRLQPLHLDGLIEEVLAEPAGPWKGRIVTHHAVPESGLVNADTELLRILLRQLLDNAAKYSPPGSPISITLTGGEGRAQLCIRNEGPGIPEHEQAQVFERFYRGPVSSRNTAGTGMGLAIVREIVQAHQGSAWVQSIPGQGAQICVALPTLEAVPAAVPA